MVVADEQGRPVDVDRLAALAAFVLADLRLPPMEVSVRCVGRSVMADLNAEHMGQAGPTDVLAFPLDRPGEGPSGVPAMLGDVVLCPDVAAEHLRGRDRALQDELDLLLVHGLLHLLGHDHAERAERERMFATTDRLLAAFPCAGGERRWR